MPQEVRTYIIEDPFVGLTHPDVSWDAANQKFVLGTDANAALVEIDVTRYFKKSGVAVTYNEKELPFFLSRGTNYLLGFGKHTVGLGYGSGQDAEMLLVWIQMMSRRNTFPAFTLRTKPGPASVNNPQWNFELVPSKLSFSGEVGEAVMFDETFNINGTVKITDGANTWIL